MSERDDSPSSNANSDGILATKKSKVDVDENKTMELDQSEQNSSQMNLNEDVTPNQTGQPLGATDSVESKEFDGKQNLFHISDEFHLL